MKKQAKKGFTIVELVIVIALIAILAAVLIPTFSNVINNAHESSDTMMVKNLNTILNSEETLGNGAKTMQDAIDQAEAGGYKVEKLTPTSSGDIVWDQKSNRFLLINAKGSVVYRDESVTDDLDPTNPEVAYKLWKISHNAVDDAAKAIKYSLYLADGAAAPAGAVDVGIDVGVNANVAVSFKSDAAREVIIRTNGGTLNVDAANATVSHYGEAEKVVIAAVADHSFHEYGKVVGNIEIAKGRVVMETGSAASAIKVTATKEEVTNGAKVVVDTKTSNVAVVVPAEVKDEIIAKGGSINAADDKVVTDTTVIENMNKFAGGLGTAESPYLIANLEQWIALAEESNTYSSLAMQGKYFSVLCDLDFENVDKQVQIQFFNGHITFNGHTVKNLQIDKKQCKVLAFDAYAFLFACVEGQSSVSDLTFVTHSPKVDYAAKLIGYTNFLGAKEVNEVLVENVEVTGVARFSDNNTGLFVYWAGSGTLHLKDCSNTASIYNTGYTGAFVGRCYVQTETKLSYCTKMIFENCNNYGTIVNTNANRVCMLLANPSGTDKTEIVVKNCTNYGTIIATTTKFLDGVQNKGMLSNSAYKELSVENGKFVIAPAAGAVRYEMLFTFSGAAIGGGVASKVFTLTEADLNNVDAFQWVDGKDVDAKQIVSEEKFGTTVKTCNGKYVFSDELKSYVKKQPVVTLTAYGADDTIVAIYVYNYNS